MASGRHYLQINPIRIEPVDAGDDRKGALTEPRAVGVVKNSSPRPIQHYSVVASRNSGALQCPWSVANDKLIPPGSVAILPELTQRETSAGDRRP